MSIKQNALAKREFNLMQQTLYQAKGQLLEEEYLLQSMINESGLNSATKQELFYGKAFIVKPIFG